MSIRIHKLAEELGMENKELMALRGAELWEQAISAGATHVDVSVLGIGERVGVAREEFERFSAIPGARMRSKNG